MDMKRSLLMAIVISIALASAAFSACAGGTPSGNYIQGPLADDANVIYLHHSTGGNVWGGGVP